MAIKPWKKVGARVSLANKHGKELFALKFINPNTGAEVEYTQFAQRDWSVILALTESGEVLVVSQYKQGCDCVIEELPAGTADWKDEKPELVAARELRQETGYKPKSLKRLGSGWIATRNSPTQFHCFLALGCTRDGEVELDANEDIESTLVPFHVWLGLVMSGRIQEPSSIMATMLALPHLSYRLTAPTWLTPQQ